MFKKNVIFLSLLSAYLLMLAHSFIPHHHHNNKQEAEHHHQHEQGDHHHHDDTDAEDFNLLFTHFIHSGDINHFTTSHNITNTFSKQQLSVAAFLNNNFVVNKIFIPPLLYEPPAEHLICISPHSHCKGLRAPPAFIG